MSDDDWETDPDFENDVTEEEQRYGAKTIGFARTDIDMKALADSTKEVPAYLPPGHLCIQPLRCQLDAAIVYAMLGCPLSCGVLCAICWRLSTDVVWDAMPRAVLSSLMLWHALCSAAVPPSLVLPPAPLPPPCCPLASAAAVPSSGCRSALPRCLTLPDLPPSAGLRVEPELWAEVRRWVRGRARRRRSRLPGRWRWRRLWKRLPAWPNVHCKSTCIFATTSCLGVVRF